MQQLIIEFIGTMFAWFLMVGLFLLIIVCFLAYLLGYADLGEDNVE